MKAQQIDILNIGLIILSGVLAYLFPLQLFVVSFAILGPLHYLTEINWLDKKQYFTSNTKRIWLWIGVVSSVIIVFPKLYFYFNGSDESSMAEVVQFINSWSNSLIFMSLILAAAFVFLKRRDNWIFLIVLGLIGAFFLNTNDTYTTVIGLFVPTIIHVYIFTLLFMLYGAKKSKSSFGYIAVAAAIIVPIVFTSVHVDQAAYLFSDNMKDTYLQNNFHVAPVVFAKFIGISDGKSFFFHETMELRLMMFISFIYLYHYLNWFSKTTLIQWHKTLTTKNSIVIIALWVIILGLFYFDFRLGFIVSLFFGVLHVIVEFPLNLISIKGIFTKGEEGST